jgi:hypothetical protein
MIVDRVMLNAVAPGNAYAAPFPLTWPMSTQNRHWSTARGHVVTREKGEPPGIGHEVFDVGESGHRHVIHHNYSRSNVP